MKTVASLVVMLALLLTCGALAVEQGEEVPDFELTLTDDSAIKLSDSLGKIVIVDLWASWCPPCVNFSMPALDQIAQEYPDDVTVISVNCGESADKVRQFALDRGYTLNVAIDEEMNILYNYFPTNGIPYCAFIDREGRLYTTVVGANTDIYDRYKELIEEIGGLENE